MTKKVICSMIFIVMIFAVMLCGCYNVYLKHPLSEVSDPVDKEKLEGAWILEGDVVYLKFDEKGKAALAGMEWEENKFVLNHAEMIVTKGKEHNFINIRVEEDGEMMEEYIFAQYSVTDDGDLIIWLPDRDFFQEALASKKLEGKSTESESGGTILIESSPEKVMSLIDDPDNNEIFMYEDPMIIKRLPR